MLKIAEKNRNIIQFFVYVLLNNVILLFKLQKLFCIPEQDIKV